MPSEELSRFEIKGLSPCHPCRQNLGTILACRAVNAHTPWEEVKTGSWAAVLVFVKCETSSTTFSTVFRLPVTLPDLTRIYEARDKMPLFEVSVCNQTM